MNRLPDPTQQPTQPAGQTPINPAARAFLADVEEALAEAARVPAATSYRDPRPTPPIGTTPPVPQPGRPAMSEKAVDDTARMIGASLVIGMTGAAGTSILWASGHANPEVIAWACAVPVSVAVPVLALSRLVKRTKDVAAAAPAEQHHHYNGPVTQDHRTYTSETRGIWASTRNQHPK